MNLGELVERDQPWREVQRRCQEVLDRLGGTFADVRAERASERAFGAIGEVVRLNS